MTAAAPAARSVGSGIGTSREFLIAIGIGALTGLSVAIIEVFALEFLLEEALHAPLFVQCLLPGIGLLLTWIVLRVRHGSTTTSDAYVAAFHGDEDLPARSLVDKIAAATATLGSGGALGLEGPAVHLGATVGRSAGVSSARATPTERRGFLVAGAAAGVAAVFKAPATGVLFALETPYRRDVARHGILPALGAASAAYLVFVLIVGEGRLLEIEGGESGLTHEVGGALLVGLVGGLVARATAVVFTRAKYLHRRHRISHRLPVAVVVLALAAVLGHELVHEAVTLGPGAHMAAELVTDADISIGVLLGVFGLRLLATGATLAGGGVGGLFIPLVVQGLLLGRIVELVVGAPSTGLYPVIGLAAVLGAGYRTPLAAVTFVAETTGRAEFVIPALLATAVSQALMGEVSVSSGQVAERRGRLEQRLERPASQVALAGVPTLTPDQLLTEVIDNVDAELRTPAHAVITGDQCQLLLLHDIAPVMFEKGEEATVKDAMRSIPPVEEGTPAAEAARLMNTFNCAAIAVVDADGSPTGIITAETLAGLDDVDLDQLDL